MQLSEDERALYSELIVQIALRMVELFRIRDIPGLNPHWEAGDSIKGIVVEHLFSSVFERACAILQGATAVHPLDSDLKPKDDPAEWAACFQMMYSVSELRDHLGANPAASEQSLVLAQQSFLTLTTDFGETQPVPTFRKAFAVLEGYVRTFGLLARCGYVESVGDKMKWTDRIAPMMRAIYAWNDAGVSKAELQEAEIEEMWRTIPPKIRDVFFSGGGVDVVSLGAAISQYWKNGKWQIADPNNGQIIDVQRRPSSVLARGLA